MKLFGLLGSSGRVWGAPRFSSLGRARAAARDAVERLEQELTLIRAPLDLANTTLKREARAYLDVQRTARLAAIPVEALKDVGVTGVRWSTVRDGGIYTMAELAHQSKAHLLTIPGIGAATAESVLTIAQQVYEQVLREPIALPSPETLDVDGEHLVRAAAVAMRARAVLKDIAPTLEKKTLPLRARLELLLQTTSFRHWLFGGRENHETAIREAQQIVREVESAEVSTLVRTGHERYAQLRTPPPVPVLEDFRARYADYCAVIRHYRG